MMSDIIQAHKHSIYHRQEIKSSRLCGCFHCVSIYQPSLIMEWTDNETTALCPKCGIDSVIGSASNFPITDRFLSAMNNYWFGYIDDD